VPVVEEETGMQMEQVEEFSFSSDDEDDDVQEPPTVAVPAIEYASYPPSNFFPTRIRHDDTNRVIENATNAESSLQRSMREGELLLESLDRDRLPKRDIHQSETEDKMKNRLQQMEKEKREQEARKRGKK
jgi:hypothetical protein